MSYGKSIKTRALGEKAIADTLVIPSGATAIPDFAFSGCGKLTGMNVPSGVTSIGHCAFSGCGKLTSITIPQSVTGIEDRAFESCGKLVHIEIPNSVTSIGERAFECCRNLKSITIPGSVTRIGKYAFSNCDSLQYNEYDNSYYLGNSENPYVVLIKAENKNITSCAVNSGTNILYGYAFCYCRALTDLTFAENSRLTSIGSCVFYDCESLRAITIPQSVTSIGESAFYGCSRLTRIAYKGTKTQWREISKGYHWNCHTGDYTVTCTDGMLSKSASEQ
ncbi:MAG: leucine-rich repeat domain-containing protein [Clostridiales bacterium]|nr:leucine-rich repeat domain-containing protein [Clostridiales bacterium]